MPSSHSYAHMCRYIYTLLYIFHDLLPTARASQLFNTVVLFQEILMWEISSSGNEIKAVMMLAGVQEEFRSHINIHLCTQRDTTSQICFPWEPSKLPSAIFLYFLTYHTLPVYDLLCNCLVQNNQSQMQTVFLISYSESSQDTFPGQSN